LYRSSVEDPAPFERDNCYVLAPEELPEFSERVTSEVEADISGNRQTSRSRFAITRQAVGDGKARRRDWRLVNLESRWKRLPWQRALLRATL